MSRHLRIAAAQLGPLHLSDTRTSATNRLVNLLREQPKKVADLIAADMKIASKVMEALVQTNHYTAVIDQSVIDGIGILQDELLSAKKLKSRVDPLALFDLRLVRELALDLIKVKVEAR